MHMQNEDPKPHDDKDFANLLGSYAAPIADNGFSNAVLQSIDIAALQAVQARQSKFRMYSLYAAASLGAVIASFQLPSAIDIFSFLDLSHLNLISINFADLNAAALPDNLSIGIILSLALALWALLDSKSLDIF